MPRVEFFLVHILAQILLALPVGTASVKKMMIKSRLRNQLSIWHTL